MADEQVTMKWAWGRATAPVIEQPQAGFLALDIIPPASINVPAARPNPLNLVFVLDHSGSMDEDNKLGQLKQAVKQALDQLDSQDRVSVVVFSDRDKVIVESTTLADANLDEIKAKIDAIKVEGGTTMSRGMRTGLEQLKNTPPDTTYANRMILLTDGQTWGDAPGGDEPVCRTVAEDAAAAGVAITALGLGTDWNEKLLDDIAEAGGGQADFIAQPDQIGKYFERTVQEMKEATINNVTLIIRLGGGVEARTIYQMTPMIRKLKLENIQTDNVLTVKLGDIPLGRNQTVLAELLLPARPAGTFRMAQTELTYDAPDGSSPQEVQADVTLTYEVGPAEPQRTSLDPRVMNLVEKATAFRLQTTALSEAEVGNIASATTKLRAAATRLLNLGEVELANQAEAEAAALETSGQMSAAGTKKLTFATRKLAQTELDEAMPAPAPAAASSEPASDAAGAETAHPSTNSLSPQRRGRKPSFR